MLKGLTRHLGTIKFFVCNGFQGLKHFRTSGLWTAAKEADPMTTTAPIETKLSKLKAAADAGDWPLALRIAARFSDLGEHKAAIKRAHEAHANARFYRSLGKDPEALIADGIAALRARYGIA